MGIGARIKELRKKMHMTQPELADRIGVHETTIRRWEHGKDKGPDTKSLNAIAEVLKTTPEYIMKGTGTDNPEDDETTEKTLIYEWGGTNRLALPNTPETRELFERLVMSSMSGAMKGVTA